MSERNFGRVSQIRLMHWRDVINGVSHWPRQYLVQCCPGLYRFPGKGAACAFSASLARVGVYFTNKSFRTDRLYSHSTPRTDRRPWFSETFNWWSRPRGGGTKRKSRFLWRSSQSQRLEKKRVRVHPCVAFWES